MSTIALMFSLNLCLRGSGKSNTYRESNDVSGLLPDSLSQILQTRTLEAGVCHSSKMVAAHTTATDSIAQPQITRGRWESLISRHTGSPPRSGPNWGPTGPRPWTSGHSSARGFLQWLKKPHVPCHCQYLQWANSSNAPTQHCLVHLGWAPQHGPDCSCCTRARKEGLGAGSSSALREPPRELWSFALLSSLGSNSTAPTGKERAQLLPAHLVSADLNT